MGDRTMVERLPRSTERIEARDRWCSEKFSDLSDLRFIGQHLVSKNYQISFTYLPRMTCERWRNTVTEACAIAALLSGPLALVGGTLSTPNCRRCWRYGTVRSQSQGPNK